MSNKANKSLEELVRSALKDHEMPYDPSAWRELSSKLDATLPVQGKSKWPWFLGAASVLGIFTVSMLYMSTSEEVAKNSRIVSESKEASTTPTKKVQLKINENKIEQPNLQLVVASPSVVISCGIQNQLESPISVEKVESIVEPEISTTEVSNINILPAQIPSNRTDVQTNSWLSLRIPSLCLGESHTIENKNTADLLIRDAYSNEIVVPALSSYSYTALHEGKHEVMNAATKEVKESFIVKNSPQLSVQLESDLIYERGLPTTILNATSTGTTVNWEMNGRRLANESNQLKVNLFTKGTYTFKATSMNEFGCKSDAVRTLYIDDEYNLLAVNAFDPQSNDNRKNSFMPYALTVREVDFELIIIDPKDGSVLFESNDATLPWRGQDKRTGQLVEASKTFIWRVILSNPQPGEKSEYKGTIVRL